MTTTSTAPKPAGHPAVVPASTLPAVDPHAVHRWPTVAEQVRDARRARDEGIAQAEDADGAAWDRAVIDQAIDCFADTGEPFCANDLRDLLPEVRPQLIGARFYAASVQHRIREVGYVRSTKRNTHAKRVAVWVGAQAVTEPEAAAS